jgi:hypothetical protein
VAALAIDRLKCALDGRRNARRFAVTARRTKETTHFAMRANDLVFKRLVGAIAARSHRCGRPRRRRSSDKPAVSQRRGTGERWSCRSALGPARFAPCCRRMKRASRRRQPGDSCGSSALSRCKIRCPVDAARHTYAAYLISVIAWLPGHHKTVRRDKAICGHDTPIVGRSLERRAKDAC